MPRVHPRAATISLAITVALVILIYFGSRGLRYFDSALIGYAVASVFALLGISYRFLQWLSRPPTRLYWLRGWQLFLSWENFRRFGGLIPRVLWQNQATQSFLRPRPRGLSRWIGHLSLFWGVVLSALITFPLVFGWLVLRSPGGNLYQLYFFGFPTFVFDPRSLFGWIFIHALDFTAAMVLLGVGLALRRRTRDREVIAEQSFGFDFVPLLLLAAISISGLLLTANSLFWEGRFYWFVALAHQAVVVLGILYVPFGKFFHILERPASVGIELYRAVAGRVGGALCARCGREYASGLFVGDLIQTLRDLNQDYAMPPDGRRLQEYCPECKRILRANSYFSRVHRGFL
ncbi:MAG: MFS transporter [Chloroflexota bacterium]